MSTQWPTDPRRGLWFVVRLGAMVLWAILYLTAIGLAEADAWSAVGPLAAAASAVMLGVATWDAFFLARRRRRAREGQTVPVRFDALDSRGIVVGFSLLSCLAAVFGGSVDPLWRVLSGGLAVAAVVTCVATHRIFTVRPDDVRAGVESA